ncbi:MAG TPA: hypothetical protein VI455_17050 [Terriglobia bacterium]
MTADFLLWIPALAGMTMPIVTPAKTGVHSSGWHVGRRKPAVFEALAA